ncbi:hypothetical protein COCSUDRAFT_61868 [Coccomyxa subellipsoidea C-169]|uniref:Magnesium transporter MgtE intracellular domain-containing protein n=1 Tax=Coccomyxa subellipsoidea (strain C-169) TaxID=574566 RepID=I0Z1C4_COCSC|nr:hypothetical protein COCSUDRAFT_61868 [Coccomyxa subellipsoidea C-169]EIE24443.1 hypothetical protein COCSUDRAFT_61868 [Coccomyxa subellipsoidea C-169]|eukprot:XP_005648987.1 hypothetical protein COCSUDRAFT_61868 [Coccomyxa subellipsoidea C-169]
MAPSEEGELSAGSAEGLQASTWYTKRAQQRWVVPASGMRRLRRASSNAGSELASFEEHSASSGLQPAESTLKRGDLAVSHMRGEHELSPALKALSQLNHDDSGGWIHDLDRLQSKGSAVLGGNAGIPGLKVLPSDGPSGRHEAAEVHALLRNIAAAPAFAAERALTWREEVLERLCRRALDQPENNRTRLVQKANGSSSLPASTEAIIGVATYRDPGNASEKSTTAASNPSRTFSDGGLNGVGSRPGLAWDAHCMAGVLLGAGIAMADLIRQAEGACAERGAALAAAWNLHTAVCDSIMESLREEAAQQEQKNITLQAELMHLQSAAEDNKALQREIDRLCKEVQAHEVAAARAAIKEAEAEEKLQSGLAELDAVERMARRLLAGMRWRQATILQGSAHKQSLFRLPSARSPCPQPVLQQVAMLQGTSMALAVSTFRRDRTRAEQRLALQRASADSGGPGSRFANVVQDTMVGSAALLSAMAGDAKKAAQMLDTLAPEAQAMVLATLAPSERTGLLRGMSDEGAAACLAAMSLNARGGVIADLTTADPTLATCALAFIWHSAALAGKWLGSMAAPEAARELLENTDLPQQRQVLLRMKAHRAAALLEEMEAHTREGILQGLAPEATAAILQAMPRAMALSSLQALIKPIAQQVLACFGGSERAALLSHLSVSDTLRLIQGWVTERQREFLQALPASTATEATVQLLLQSSHKWTYSPPVPAAVGAGYSAGEDGEDFSEQQEAEEEVDQEEVEELREAAGMELRAAAAAVFGLPFEDKAKLIGALPPTAAAALTGTLTRQEGAQLMSELPQPQLIAILEAMGPLQRSETEDALLAISKSTGSPRRRSLRSILRPERPDTASSIGSRASNMDSSARRTSRLSIRAGNGSASLSIEKGVGMMVRDARVSRKSVVRPPTGGSVEEQTQGVQLRPSKVGFRKSMARPSLAGNNAQEAAQDPNQRPSKFGPRKSMAPSTRADTP